MKPLEMYFQGIEKGKFFIISQDCSQSGELPPMPFRIFVDHVTIFNSSPMQHLRWSSSWQKKVNGWKVLLTVVTYIELCERAPRSDSGMHRWI